MIVGAQKAGTTSLKNYLAEHPDVLSHPQLEFSYFAVDQEYEKSFDTVFRRWFTLGNAKSYRKVVAKNASLSVDEKAISRLAKHNPDCDVVILLRNPIQRAYSSYRFEIQSGSGLPPFDELLNQLDESEAGIPGSSQRILIEFGNYASQLGKLWRFFPRQQVHTYFFEDLVNEPRKICDEIFIRLGLHSEIGINAERIHNKTGKARSARVAKVLHWLKQERNPIKRAAKKIMPYSFFTRASRQLQKLNRSEALIEVEPMSDQARERLRQIFMPANIELGRMLSVDLSHWDE